MSDKPYVNFYTSDFLAGTGGMTAACKGVYITLLCQMYEAEAPLGQSWDALARRCGATLPAFKKAVETLVEDGKIVVTDDGIWSPKCEKHITLRRERQNSAKAAAKTRWEKSKEKQGKDHAGAVKPQCQPEPEPEPYISKEDTNVSLSISSTNDAADAVRFFNEIAGQLGWSQVQKMTPQRARSLKARLADCGGIEGWRGAVDRAAQSDFLSGRTSKPWTGFGFDWLVKAQNFTKLMEGNYDNRNRSGNTGLAQGRQDRPDPALEQIARLAGLGAAPGNGGR